MTDDLFFRAMARAVRETAEQHGVNIRENPTAFIRVVDCLLRLAYTLATMCDDKVTGVEAIKTDGGGYRCRILRDGDKPFAH